MGIFSVIVTVASLVFGVLGIILFFKVWRMCNDVAEIKNRFKSVCPTVEEEKAAEWLNKMRDGAVSSKVQGVGTLTVGDNVIYEPMNRRMIIKEITKDGLLVCVSYKQDGGEEYEGTYKPNQVKRC